jgi:Zn-dependent protease
VNIVLGVFNLLPLPPLDGSKILAGFLPRRAAQQYLQIERYGFIILILLVMTGVFGKFLNAVVGPIYSMLF